MKLKPEELKELAKQTAIELAPLLGSKFVTSSGIALMCGFSAGSSSVYKLIKNPTFPKPIQLGEEGQGRRRWYREDVEAWLENNYSLKGAVKAFNCW